MRSVGQRSLGDKTYIRRPQLYMRSMESEVTHWETSAKCAGMDPENFFYEGSDTAVRLYKGRNACYSCPVRRECLDAATEDDLQWSVRGGRLPLAMKDRESGPSGRVKSDSPPEIPPSRCGKGHDREWYHEDVDTWRPHCPSCSAARAWAYRNKRPVEEYEPRKQLETCSKGHSEWRNDTRKRNGKVTIRRRCAVCARARVNESAARRRAARKAAVESEA